MALIDRLRERRDRIQAQLDRWVARGFRGGGKASSDDATQKETAQKVADVAELHRIIAEQGAKNQDA